MYKNQNQPIYFFLAGYFPFVTSKAFQGKPRGVVQYVHVKIRNLKVEVRSRSEGTFLNVKSIYKRLTLAQINHSKTENCFFIVLCNSCDVYGEVQCFSFHMKMSEYLQNRMMPT